MEAILKLMIDCLSHGDQIYLPSKFWIELNSRNLNQLEMEGIGNFKQTVSQNYFTWIIARHRLDQFLYLTGHIKLGDWFSILDNLFSFDSTSRLARLRQIELGIFTRMLWRFAGRNDTDGLLHYLEEPRVGNPFSIFLGKKLISQDMANSVLEYYSIREHFTAAKTSRVTLCEIGAGYGRSAFVFLKAFPNGKYIVIDIPPALYISQHYLSSIFPEKRVFSFRCFERFSEVDQEFHDSDIAFLLPHQAAMLPRKSVDLFINISSLHEMKVDQINAYFQLIDRLTRGFFYTKQWLVSHNPADGITIGAHDYPVPPDWQQLYFRKAKVQTLFFEAMYKIGTNESV
jgi:putative sugar O-methyltransferase